MCDRTGCDKEPTCVPKLRIPAVGYPIDSHQPLSLLVGVAICDECAKLLTVEDLAPSGQHAGIRAAVRVATQNTAEADWDRAFIEWLMFDSAEYKKLSAVIDTIGVPTDVQ